MFASRRAPAVFASLVLASFASCAKAPEKETATTVAVTIAPVERGALDETLALEGRLVPPPGRDATLAPQAAGRVEEVPVREGDAVAKGDLLAVVDARAADEALRAARAGLAKAEQEEKAKARVAETSAALFAKGIAAAEEKDNDRAAAEAARSGVVDAQAQLAKAERDRAFTRLVAPFDGVVAQVLKHPGETVDGTPATAVVRLLGTGATEVAVAATSADLARLAPGQQATVAAAGAAPLPARVARVARAVDPATGLGEARLALLAPTRLPLLSSVKATVVVARHPGLLLVPASALRRAEDGSEEAVVVKDGVAHPRPVVAGIRAGRVEVKSGLAEGETVVTDSPIGLSEGARVALRGAAAPKG